MRGHFFVRGKANALILKSGRNGGGVGHDERNDEPALIADDHGVQDVGASLERVFNRLRRDELPSRGLDQIFFAVGDEEIVVGIEIADIAGVKPAVFGDANENVGNRTSRAAAAILWIVGGQDGGSLGQAVALVNWDADGPEKFGELLGKGRAAGKDHAQFSAGSGADFFVDELVSESPLGLEERAGTLGSGTPGSGAPGDVDRPIKQGALDSGGFASLLHQLRVNLFEETRHRGDNRWTDFEQSLRDKVDGFDVGDAHAIEEVDVIQHAAVDVGERQERQSDVGGGLEIEGGAGVRYVGRHIVVREHHAFRLAGGAGGVDDGAQLAGEHLRGAHAVGGYFGAARGGDQRFVAQAFSGHVSAGVSDDDVFEFGQLCAAGQELLQLVRASHDNHARAGMLEDVGHAVRRFVEINGDGDAAGAVDGEIGGVPLRAIGGEKAHTVAWLDAQLDQRHRKAGDAA